MVIDGNSSDGLKLALVFFQGIGSPKKFNSLSIMEDWSYRLAKLMRMAGDIDDHYGRYDSFKWFVRWCTRMPDADGASYGNTWTAKNLRVSHDPMTSMEKQFDMTFNNVFLPEHVGMVNRLQKHIYMDLTSSVARPVASPAQDAGTLSGREIGSMYPETLNYVPEPSQPHQHQAWRCSGCVYGISEQDDDNYEEERIVWCADCTEERILWEQDDMEWMDDDTSDLPSPKLFRIFFQAWLKE